MALAMIGCRSELLPGAGLGGPADGGTVSPGSDGGACGRHVLEAVPLSELVQLDPVSVPRQGTSLRLLARHPLRAGCDRPGAITVEIQPGDATDFVTVTAHLWRGGIACGSPMTATRVVVLPLPADANPNLSIRDGAPGAHAALLTSTRFAVTDELCSRPAFVGQPCLRDCQCTSRAPTARCVSVPVERFACAIPCRADAECPDGQSCSLDQHQCVTRQECGCPLGCPAGQSCRRCGCRPDAASPGGPCRCDSDCRGGRICDGQSCVLPCATAADCPPGLGICLRSTCQPGA